MYTDYNVVVMNMNYGYHHALPLFGYDRLVCIDFLSGISSMLEDVKSKAGRYCHGYQSDDFQLEGQHV